MRVSVADRLEITDKRVTSAGYLAVRAKIAKEGVYKYARKEIGMTDGDPNELVGVYRSHDWVFDPNNLATFAHKPVCIGHPSETVNSNNWKKLSVGQIGDKVWEAEDRKHVQVDMLLMDQAGINAAQTHSQEISAGYSCDIQFDGGISPDGEPYVAIMTGQLTADHIALVPQGRAGSQARIGDAAWPDNPTPTPPKKETLVPHIMHDGLKIDLSDAEAVSALVTKLTAAAAAAEAKLADSEAKVVTDAAAHVVTVQAKDALIAAKDVEVADLKAEAEKNKITPEMLRDAAASFAKTVDLAKRMGTTVTDAMSEADVKKAAVILKMADTASGYTDAQIDIAFTALSASAPAPQRDPLRDALTNVVPLADARAEADKARAEMIANFSKKAS